jgi:hypothetical protein
MSRKPEVHLPLFLDKYYIVLNLKQICTNALKISRHARVKTLEKLTQLK